MIDLTTADFFESNPVRAFKNAGIYQRRRWHWVSDQPYDCFYYVAKGTMQLQLGKQEYVLKTDDAFFLARHEQARLRSDGDEECVYYFVSFYTHENTNLELAPVCRNAGLLSLFKELVNAHRSEAPMSRLRVAQLFLQLLLQYATQTDDAQRALSSASKLHAALEYVHTHFDQKMTLADLCRASGYSPAHLRRLFAQELGASPKEYILQKRIHVAKELLLDTPERSMEEIAASLGFCSASYFCKLFKQVAGMTPLAYKKSRRV